MDNYFFYDEKIEYPVLSPYNPDSEYAEYPFNDNNDGQNPVNSVYNAIRETFRGMGLDRKNYGTKDWNPLGEYIHEGETVLIKPNLVNHVNPTEKDYRKGMECLITHPSVVRCIFDYIYIALKGRGTIIIADAPVQVCDFYSLLKNTGYGQLFNYIKEKETVTLRITVADLREVYVEKNEGVPIQKELTTSFFRGVDIDLKRDSYFSKIKKTNRLRVTMYDGQDTSSNHNKNRNVYRISEAVISADVIFSLPKPKTHRIAGYTGALKNIIGVNTRKEYLPHHQMGSTDRGGDEYTPSHRFLKSINSIINDKQNWALKRRYIRIWKALDHIGRITGKKLDCYEPQRVKFGMWYGNDTIWRTILDVNHIVYFSDKHGVICNSPQRKIIYIGDMIVSGDHEGPLRPSYKRIGGILFSENPLVFDAILVAMMGFKRNIFPVLQNASKDKKLFVVPDYESLVIKSNRKEFDGRRLDDISGFGFVLASGWSNCCSHKD